MNGEIDLNVIKKICVSYEPTGDIFYLAGESLVTTEADVSKKVKKYFKIPETDDIFFIYDTTWFATWKYGFAICTSGIYFCQRGVLNSGMYSWEAIKKIQIYADDITIRIGRVMFFDREYKGIGEMLQKIQNAVKMM